MKILNKTILLCILIFISLLYLPTTIYSQPSVCKIVFCNCCGDSATYEVFDIFGNHVGDFETRATLGGCIHIDNWVNLVPWNSYYVQPKYNCTEEGQVKTYFTACVCPDSLSWLDTVKIICCQEPTIDAGSYNLHNKSKDNLLPNAFILYQNYPNPFNPTTSIKYALPIESNILLSVFDVTGKEIVVLVNGNVKAGFHEINWDASSIASGIYFCKLKVGNQIFEKKMVLLK